MNQITVVVMTYNHVNYIRQTLDSILSQQIDEKYNILIHDDCSSDGTSEIVMEYKDKYPQIIEVIRQKTRKFLLDGFNKMILQYVVPLIDSKYVAYCDGDDYWCDNLKLQKQFDYLESHPDYSMCCHSAYQLKSDGDMSSKWFLKKDGDISIKDLLSEKPGIPIATSSVFVKSEIFKNFTDWRKSYTVEDLPLFLMAAINGKIHRIKDPMCVYRQFSNGSWSAQNFANKEKLITHQINLINGANLFDIQTDLKYHCFVDNHINGCVFRIAILSKDFKTIFLKKYKYIYLQLPIKERISLKLQYRFPSLYNLLRKHKKD